MYVFVRRVYVCLRVFALRWLCMEPFMEEMYCPCVIHAYWRIRTHSYPFTGRVL